MKKPRLVRRQHARATIGDVAERAGVSPMTVSRVMNGEINVRGSTRDAVRRAIDELGYSPNKAARSLASASQLQFGLIYGNPSSSFLSAMLLGVLEQARRSDTQIVVVECDTEAQGVAAISRMIKSGIDGLVLSPPLADSEYVLEILQRNATPAVTIGTQHTDHDIHSIQIDDYQAGYAMTRHIIELGHRHIGFIAGNPMQRSSGLRLSGYRDALREQGIDYDAGLVAQGYFTYRSGLAAAEQLLALPRRPTAVFASNDDMAAATIATAHRHRIDVPGELTVCGVDDTLLATTIWPEITTVHQPIVDMSHAAIDILEKAIRMHRTGMPGSCQHVTVDFRLVRRGSDGPPPASAT